MGIQRGDELILGGNRYLVTGNESERGFGLDGEPKFWVKRGVDLRTRDEKIIKLVFFESFKSTIGSVPVVYYRSPKKEAEVLKAVRDHMHFMHGFSAQDSAGNQVRIIDRIKGVSLRKHVLGINAEYEEYYFDYLPGILRKLLGCFAALAFVHDQGHVHGDVRWDHILIDAQNGLFRWIDFDYTYHFPEHPASLDLFGLGNILAAVVGMGPVSPHDLKNNPRFEGGRLSVRWDDFSLVEKFRLMNLRAVYPVISKKLNRVLLHFSERSSVFYESVAEITADLGAAMSDMRMP
jgi:hypothetical protein